MAKQKAAPLFLFPQIYYGNMYFKTDIVFNKSPIYFPEIIIIKDTESNTDFSYS